MLWFVNSYSTQSTHLVVPAVPCILIPVPVRLGALLLDTAARLLAGTQPCQHNPGSRSYILGGRVRTLGDTLGDGGVLIRVVIVVTAGPTLGRC